MTFPTIVIPGSSVRRDRTSADGKVPVVYLVGYGDDHSDIQNGDRGILDLFVDVSHQSC